MSNPAAPSAVKRMRGTDRKDRRNDLEPEPDVLDDLTPPAHLSDASAQVWAQVAPMLRRIRVLTVADVIALEMLCDAVADYRHARSELGADFVHSTPKGGKMISQWLVAQQMSSKRAEAFMSKFGMDPVSRSRVMVDPQASLFDEPGKGPARFFQ